MSSSFLYTNIQIFMEMCSCVACVCQHTHTHMHIHTYIFLSEYIFLLLSRSRSNDTTSAISTSHSQILVKVRSTLPIFPSFTLVPSLPRTEQLEAGLSHGGKNGDREKGEP